MRRGALLNEAQNIGMSPTSVAGGEKALGNCELIAGFCGPGSVTLAGWFLVLISPCGGSSGLPKLAALAAVATEPAAAAASTVRRDTESMDFSFRQNLRTGTTTRHKMQNSDNCGAAASDHKR